MKGLESTLKSLSNFPANASKRVVFPEEGGPSRRAILYRTIRMVTLHYTNPNYNNEQINLGELGLKYFS